MNINMKDYNNIVNVIQCPENKKILLNLENIWKTNNYSGDNFFNEQVMANLEANENPYKLSLYLSMNAFDYFNFKNFNFSHSILIIFDKWINCKSEKYLHLVNDELKKCALILSTRNHINLFAIIVQLYQLKTMHAIFLTTFVQALLYEKKYLIASIIIKELDMYSMVEIYKDVLIPLALISDTRPIYTFLKNMPTEQKIFIQMLDGYIGNIHILQEFAHQLEYKDIKINLDNKKLVNIVKTLLKTFKLKSKICPNLKKNMIESMFRYYLYKQNCARNKIIDENTHDLIKLCFDQYPSMRLNFINLLLESYLDDYSWYWSYKYGYLPHLLKQPINIIRVSYISLNKIVYPLPSIGSLYKYDVTEEAEVADNFYHLKISSKHIHMVENISDFKTFLATLLDKSITAIGMDAEWNPCSVPDINNESQIDLFQVATNKDIFLFDMLNLSSNNVEMVDCWRAFAQVMKNPHILKIGFDFEQDLDNLKSHTTKNCKVNLDFKPLNFLDLRKFKDIFNVSLLPFHPDHRKSFATNSHWVDSTINGGVNKLNDLSLTKSKSRPKNEKGLSELVFWCFGKYLDKKEQVSRWANRPLRLSQTLYSAMDAFCLVEIHAFLIEIYFIGEIDCANTNHPFSLIQKWIYEYPAHFKDSSKTTNEDDKNINKKKRKRNKK
ncbi:unnamed protein product [Gordionus sp. m RMFG-2023]